MYIYIYIYIYIYTYVRKADRGGVEIGGDWVEISLLFADELLICVTLLFVTPNLR